MKKIKTLTLNKTSVNSSANFVNVKISGDIGAVFSLQIMDSSSPNKFYNFSTSTFTSDRFTSENVLKNQVLSSTTFETVVSIPSVSSNTTYSFLLFTDPFFDTRISRGVNSFFLRQDLSQNGPVTVRFSTSTDQATNKFENIGTFVGSVTGNQLQSSSSTISVSKYSLADVSTEPFLGYKFEFDVSTFSQKVADSLQPIDSDFFTSQSKTTSGTGSSVTDMILTNVDNLAVGMSLVSITSSAVTTSGSLGVLTFPTITAIDKNTKTVTLSSAHSWADNKAVVFRAYGAELIRKSTGGVFEFNNFSVKPGSVTGTDSRATGSVKVNGSVSNNSAVTVDNLLGISKDSRAFGVGIDTDGNKNLITGLSGDGNDIIFGGNQTVRDNVDLSILGSSVYAYINGDVTIKTFPSISTDIFFDVDRALVLATTD